MTNKLPITQEEFDQKVENVLEIDLAQWRSAFGDEEGLEIFLRKMVKIKLKDIYEIK